MGGGPWGGGNWRRRVRGGVVIGKTKKEMVAKSCAMLKDRISWGNTPPFPQICTKCMGHRSELQRFESRRRAPKWVKNRIFSGNPPYSVKIADRGDKQQVVVKETTNGDVMTYIIQGKRERCHGPRCACVRCSPFYFFAPSSVTIITICDGSCYSKYICDNLNATIQISYQAIIYTTKLKSRLHDYQITNWNAGCKHILTKTCEYQIVPNSTEDTSVYLYFTN